MVVLNNTTDDVYDYVKQCGNQRFGLVTQCVSFQTLQRNIGKLDMCKRKAKKERISYIFFF